MNKKYPLPLEKFYHWEKFQPDKPFLYQPIDRQYKIFSWKDVGREVRTMAGYLKSLDLPEKSKIALISKNCAHWIITDLAIMMAGHISVPIFPNVNVDTLKYILDHSEAKVLFVGKLDDWDSIKGGVDSNKVNCISFPFYETGGFLSWEGIMKNHEPLAEEVISDPEDILTIIYTSGTTGIPKGVVHRYASIGFATTEALSLIDINREGRAFSYLPLSHIAERMLISIGCVYAGGTIYFAESLDTFIQDLQYAKPTVFLGVPRIWTKFRDGVLEKLPEKRLKLLLNVPILKNLIKNKIKKGLGFEDTEFFISGAAPMPISLLEWFQNLGIPIMEVYGMTENCAYSHFNRPNNLKFGTVGQPLPGVEAKLSDEGEILVKSDASLRAYYKNPELTQESFDNGFFKTGDKGKIEKDGTLTITGRVKDLFKSSKGKYIAPSPIELKILKSSNVEQVCITGPSLPQPIGIIILSESGKSKSVENLKEEMEEFFTEINSKLEKHERQKCWMILKEEWTTQNGMLTPTLKLKRSEVEKRYSENFEDWYNRKEIILGL